MVPSLTDMVLCMVSYLLYKDCIPVSLLRACIDHRYGRRLCMLLWFSGINAHQSCFFPVKFLAGSPTFTLFLLGKTKNKQTEGTLKCLWHLFHQWVRTDCTLMIFDKTSHHACLTHKSTTNVFTHI